MITARSSLAIGSKQKDGTDTVSQLKTVTETTPYVGRSPKAFNIFGSITKSWLVTVCSTHMNMWAT